MMGSAESYRDGDQLELWPGLFCVVPWGGRSPRDLTGVRLRGIFKTQGAKKRERIDLCGQLELGLTQVEGTLVYQGAPLLLGEV